MDAPLARSSLQTRVSLCFNRRLLTAGVWVLVIALGFCRLCNAEVIAPEKSGEFLRTHIRANYRPVGPLNYKQARRQMFSEIDNHSGKVRCVYTGAEVATTDIPPADRMNTEHTWPQSLFNERLPMRADLHHLFPTLPKPNGARANHRFAEIPDAQTQQWWNSDDGQNQTPATSVRDDFSESTSAEFEPREDHKGNVARAMFYVWAVYGDDGIHAEFLQSQQATLVQWHEQDPVDPAERSRSAAVRAFQGNDNPFVVDETLVRRILATSPATPPQSIATVVTKTERTLDASLRASALSLLSGGEFSDSHRFPDFKLEYKPDGNIELFRLSQRFPQELPPIAEDSDLAKLLKLDFDKPEHVSAYLEAVREYCLKGNGLDGATKAFSQDEYEAHWNQTTEATWFHVPWQHYGEKGREGIHGLTREASAEPGQLAPSQTKKYQTHAVALYNNVGGYTIGQVWKNQFAPNPNAATFPIGTVVVKVLFTQATEKEVPYLVNPLIWKAYVQDPQSPTDPSKRTIQKLRLLQMDVMIRNGRTDKTGGWIFGTYCYNGELDHKNKWYNLAPVGVQWGNDEDKRAWHHNKDHTRLAVTQTAANPDLKETLLADLKKMPPQHLGWGGRLNGPADYFRSSCMSCHSTAQYPGLEKQHPDFDGSLGFEPGDEEWSHWFRNLACGESFGVYPGSKVRRKAISMDFSLQLQISIENFYDWKGRTMGGYFTFREDTARPSSEAEPTTTGRN